MDCQRYVHLPAQKPSHLLSLDVENELTTRSPLYSHIKYSNQYRATTAMNCRVKKDEILSFGKEKAAVGRNARASSFANMTSSNVSCSSYLATGALGADEFFPVACSDCGTVVGVFDHQQHYHFFNVLPSHV
jgi:hypothetical protein